MLQNPYVLLGVGALGLVGFAILLYFGIQKLQDERAAKDQAEAGQTPADPAAPETGEAAPVRPAPARANPVRSRGSAHEVLRVLRDNLTGRLVIELAGRRYTSLDEVQDAALTNGLLTTLSDLHTFTGAPAAPAAGPAAQAPVAPVPAGPKAAPANAAPPAAPKPLPPPTMNPFKQMQVLRELAKNPPPELKNITEQIDEVLQARIAGTPLAERKLRMRTGRKGEALFDLDGESYPSVDEVPDMAVRETLRAAITTWEKTQ